MAQVDCALPLPLPKDKSGPREQDEYVPAAKPQQKMTQVSDFKSALIRGQLAELACSNVANEFSGIRICEALHIREPRRAQRAPEFLVPFSQPDNERCK